MHTHAVMCQSLHRPALEHCLFCHLWTMMWTKIDKIKIIMYSSRGEASDWGHRSTSKVFTERKGQWSWRVILPYTLIQPDLFATRARPLLAVRMNAGFRRALLYRLHFSYLDATFVQSVGNHKGMIGKKDGYPLVNSDIISIFDANRWFSSQNQTKAEAQLKVLTEVFKKN